jgi:hypothetical protein
MYLRTEQLFENFLLHLKLNQTAKKNKMGFRTLHKIGGWGNPTVVLSVAQAHSYYKTYSEQATRCRGPACGHC